ncbi:MAG: glycosyltransferase [Flavisolibacter sp.]
MKARTTLVILTPGFPAGEADDTCLPERQVFVRALKKTFPDLHLVILSFEYPFFTSVYDWYGTEVHSFNGRNRGGLHRLNTWRSVWQRLKDLQKEHHMMGLLSFWLGESALVGRYFAKKHGLKHYCWLLGQDARKGNRYARLAGLQSEALIALSEALSQEFFRNYGMRPRHVIPPGLESPARYETIGERTIDILGVGSLIPLKQYDVFIEVIRDISKVIPSVRAVLCGQGPEEKRLREQVRAARLEKNIEFLLEVPNRTVLELMTRSSILLHPSAYEGFGFVCPEALRAGAHVISFCQPMNRRIDHWHIVASPKEMTDLAIGLLRSGDALDHSSVLPYPIAGTVKDTMRLFQKG